ncbi:MAG: hypothetical protein K2X27_14960 [Candidatus Obscuribacterales bacterium]|nr:hypothetical protein [Candidatus Obscuribacterales bacterium]
MDIHISFNNPVGFLQGAAWVIGCLLAGYYLARFFINRNPPRSGDDRQGMAVAFFFFAALGVLAFIVSFIMLFIGHAHIPALIGLGFFGVAGGYMSKS